MSKEIVYANISKMVMFLTKTLVIRFIDLTIFDKVCILHWTDKTKRKGQYLRTPDLQIDIVRSLISKHLRHVKKH